MALAIVKPELSLPVTSRLTIPENLIPMNKIIESWELKPTKAELEQEWRASRAEKRKLHQASLAEINNIDPQFFSRVQALKAKLKKDLTKGATSYGDPLLLKAYAKQVKAYAYHMGLFSNHTDTLAANLLAVNLWRLGIRKLKDRSPEGINTAVKEIIDGVLALKRIDKECYSPQRMLADKLLYELEMDGAFSYKVRDLKYLMANNLETAKRVFSSFVSLAPSLESFSSRLIGTPMEQAAIISDAILDLWRIDRELAESLRYSIEMGICSRLAPLEPDLV